MSVAQFFDEINQDYSEAIERCFPRYREMLCTLLDYLPRDRQFGSILELGCGTGNLSVLLSQLFPAAKIQMVDVSGDSLEVCRSRLMAKQPEATRFCFHQQDIRHIDFVANEFDLVISSITVHHLLAFEKQALFRNCKKWLEPTGVFALADQCRGETEAIYQRHIENWKQLSLAAGSTEAEFEMWMKHQREHDHHDTLADQLQWLSEAGFQQPACVWRCLLWCVIISQT